ncbi:dTDP-4-dehydrorhamnose reductase [Actinotalea sp. Marseille-Q4924]|uniref:dTDP-4-dehydrorhamnose reductase n=1 Tax=Actinotalea sp. Marseille-Q4924 TaxID=2866571 RepID=UPI001CE3E1CE|nr:dTDP-4-dehydrorhamnose reductase [Actinotalea sp. Marseille-Q4924]
MRWMVTGAGGMLGQDLVALLRDGGQEVTAHGRDTLDVTDLDAVRGAVGGHDVVVNCAAWTAVDEAETAEAEAFRVNAVGAAAVARAARDAGARLVHISTDYVFDGEATSPYAEDAPLNPRSAYGRTKGAGEWAVRAEAPDHLLVRTSWLYGAHGSCFPRTIARLARERPSLEVVRDQRGQPTWTRDLADLVVRLVDAGAPAGTYHGSASGSTTWFDFARLVVAADGNDPDRVLPTTSDRFPRPAPRPGYSVLGHEALRRAGVAPVSGWDERWAQAAPTVLAAVR